METFKRTDIRKHGFGVYIIKIRLENFQSCTKVLPLLHIRTYIEGFRSKIMKIMLILPEYNSRIKVYLPLTVQSK